MIDALERRSQFVVPVILAFVVAPLALMLLMVALLSPRTHANLAPGYDPGYSRTEQTLVGPAVPFRGMMGAAPLASDAIERGHQLFVLNACASCHGLDGRGGIVGPSIAGMNADLLRQITQRGMGGMPAFAPAALSDNDLQAIAGYLQAMSTAAPASPVPSTAVPAAVAVPIPSTPALPAPAASAPAPTPAEPGKATAQAVLQLPPSLSAGAKLYAANCAVCHGETGDGKGPAAAGMNPPATDLSDLALVRRASPQDWYNSIANGRPKTAMPGWKSARSESDIWSVIFYARSLSASSAKTAEGKALYGSSCAICHGDKGDGKGAFATGANPPPASFTYNSKMVTHSSQVLFDALTKGKGTMPGFQSSLSEGQRWDLVEYLWSFVSAP